jgi:hypothetical protein
MSEKIIDILGGVLFFGMFATPLITIPIVWRISTQKKWIRILLGLLLALPISIVLYFTGLAIIFRHGMGPG